MKKVTKDILVLKVGTSTLVEGDQLDMASFERIGIQVDQLRAAGHGVILVSPAARKRLPHVGWRGVVQAWAGAVQQEVDAYLLADQELDVAGGCHSLIAAACAGRLPIANANDAALATNSRYASNDLVGAAIAAQAKRLGLNVQYGMLSDVHGVLADLGNPDSVIAKVHDVNAYRHLAGGAGSHGATGGMATKFDAAALTTAVGISTWLAHGRTPGAVHLAMTGQIGTTFGSMAT